MEKQKAGVMKQSERNASSPPLLSATRDNTCLLWECLTVVPLLPQFRQFVAKLHKDFLVPMNTKWRMEREMLLFSVFFVQ